MHVTRIHDQWDNKLIKYMIKEMNKASPREIQSSTNKLSDLQVSFMCITLTTLNEASNFFPVK